MGGGDLNTKKAWHPSTLKNQERVWKAEQAAAEEQKRILELQRERAQERDREELNKLARQNLDSTAGSSDNRLSWMYDQKPDKKAQQEDYLLGKALDKNYDNPGKTEQNEIPAVSRRVVGSSMLTSGGDTQVDLVRKLREDPLLLVKERERAARAALLNNPVQRRKLTELLRKEQEQKNQWKSEKKSTKKNIDDILTAKLNALSGEKGMNIAKLLASDDSSSDSSSEDEKPKKKKKKKSKKKKHKSKHHNRDLDIESPARSKKSKQRKRDYSEEDDTPPRKKSKSDLPEYQKKSMNNKSSINEGNYSDTEFPHKKSNDKLYSRSSERQERKHFRESSPDRKGSRRDKNVDTGRIKREGYSIENRKKGLSEEEKSKRLAEMAAAGAEREVERSQRVATQLAENKLTERFAPRNSARNEARALPDSLESRIHSNRHNIQRDKRHMNEHFARR